MKPLIHEKGCDRSHNAGRSNDGSSNAALFFWKELACQRYAGSQFTRQTQRCNEPKNGVLLNSGYHSIGDGGNGIEKNRPEQNTFSSSFIAHDTPSNSTQENADHLNA